MVCCVTGFVLTPCTKWTARNAQIISDHSTNLSTDLSTDLRLHRSCSQDAESLSRKCAREQWPVASGPYG